MSFAFSTAATYGSVFSLVLSDSTSSLLTHEPSRFPACNNYNSYSSQRIANYAADPTDPVSKYGYTSTQDSIDAHAARMKSYLDEFDRSMALYSGQDFQTHNTSDHHSVRQGRDVLDYHHTIRSSYSQTQEQEHKELAREKTGNQPKVGKEFK